MEFEFVVLEKAGTEAEWPRNLLIDIPIWKRSALSVSIHYNNQATFARVKIKYTIERVGIYP